MNFNHDTGTIDTILIIDTTSLPPLGGANNVLQVIGSGGLILPSGASASRPTGVAGTLRYNSDLSALEYYNTGWVTLSTGGGTVSSVAITGSTGLTVSGSPITSSGTITLTLGTELQALSALSTTGIISRTAAGTYATRAINNGTGIAVTNGDGVTGNPTVALATLADSGTGTFLKITRDTYGRVSGTTAVVTSDITSLVDGTYVNVTGDTMSGTLDMGNHTIANLGTPVNATDAATKSYVDSSVQGLDPKASVRAATTTAGTLSSSFANGSAIDGITLATGDRILIKNQAAPAENGIYTVNASGAPTRATDMDAWTEVPGAYVFVEVGSTLADTAWVCTSNQGGTIDTTAITWVQFGGAGTYTAGAGLTLTGTQFALSTPVSVVNGGTGLTSTPANGALDIGNGTGFTRTTLTQGSGITITNGSGSITIANSGVTSVVAGTGIGVSGATGAVTISNTGVTSVAVSGGTTGLTTTGGPITTTGTITLTGTLAPTAGGTGLASLGTANQILSVNTGATALEYRTVTAGTGISITPTTGALTIANTGVTSVALSAPSIFTVSGSPVTTTGTLALALASQAANTVFAAPIGSSGTPTFRALAATDLPIKLYAENPSSPTAPTVAGTNAIALGSGSSASAASSVAIGDGSATYTAGSMVKANGKFATAGDAQSGTYILRNITTTATATELFIDGSSTRYVIPNNSVVTFSILIAARRTDATGGGAGYKFEGVIRKDTTAASTTIVGAAAKSILGETNTAWDAAVTADTTNGSLKITVTGEASKTIRWVATVTTSEVTN